eukprot:CAMPEP_0170189598 /NCGR_PEP_ID=MMETSP0040_2-20121228/47251_1 /TAXON_ID=641309 /ORGANISM="Lotharella oceanica, Strain CCMP622" /LENGTH=75 /DNA_ID=CAMNT_0010437215 /DNA_START=277 /DNA_END=505 /DNA_ORIENTATION=+
MRRRLQLPVGEPLKDVADNNYELARSHRSVDPGAAPGRQELQTRRVLVHEREGLEIRVSRDALLASSASLALHPG